MTQNQALNILKTGVNVFLTGEPGSGKTHTINQYVRYLKSHGIEPAITASTGIAATHIGGMTIHSWSGIGIKNYLDRYDLDRIASTEKYADRINSAHVLIIDEVSMLSGETLSMVDAVCKEVRQNNQPFGGLQIILVGDFFQLPPVSRNDGSNRPTPFAFNSPAWANANMTVCYLSEQHRHDDPSFLNLLSAIRSNSFNEDHHELIKSRMTERAATLPDIPRLFAHNVDVDQLNLQTLEKLPGAVRHYDMIHKGRAALVESLIKGCLSPEKLSLKVGAVVIFTKNNSRSGYVNGTLGKVEEFTSENQPVVKTKSGNKVLVTPVDWNYEENGTVKASINQLPLRLAWAITIHKSQGLSMDAAAMDLGKVFEFGQGYVALSRLRRLSGLHLFGYNRQAFLVHPDILLVDESFRTASEANESALDKMEEKDLRKIQESFLINSGGEIAETEIKKYDEIFIRDKTDTRDQTLALWQAGKSLDEICQERRLKAATILGHLEELVDSKKLASAELLKVVPAGLKKSLPEINAAFKKLETDKLSPVFNELGGAFSYDDLKIARLIHKFKLA